MGLVRSIGNAFAWVFRRIATRSRWLAKRLWLVALADVLLTSRRHWKRLEPEERSRFIELARESKGRPSKNLSARERRQMAELLDKLGHIEYAGSVAQTVLPFKPLSRLATKFLMRSQEDKKQLAAA